MASLSLLSDLDTLALGPPGGQRRRRDQYQAPASSAASPLPGLPSATHTHAAARVEQRAGERPGAGTSETEDRRTRRSIAAQQRVPRRPLAPRSQRHRTPLPGPRTPQGHTHTHTHLSTLTHTSPPHQVDNNILNRSPIKKNCLTHPLSLYGFVSNQFSFSYLAQQCVRSGTHTHTHTHTHGHPSNHFKTVNVLPKHLPL